MIAVAFAVAFVIAAAAGVCMVFAGQPTGPTLEIGKALLTLAVGGAASVIVKEAEQARADRLRDEDRRRATEAEWGELLRQVVGVDETLSVACLLIRAHKSAKTYRDQYAHLLDARLALRRVRLDPLLSGVDDYRLRRDLQDMQNYIEGLSTEYENHYLPVARQQRVDEIRLTRLCEAAAGTWSAPATDSPLSKPTSAWRLLTDRSTFPRLGELLAPMEFEKSRFITAYARVKPVLEERCGISRQSAYVPEVPDASPGRDAEGPAGPRARPRR